MKLITKIINKIFLKKEHKRQLQEILDWNANKKMCPESRVVCAAIRKAGVIILGARHWDSTMHLQINDDYIWWENAESGFIDQFGNFLTRKEAYTIALRQNQIIKIIGTEHSKELYSENLY